MPTTNLNRSPVIIKEGKHHRIGSEEVWAEDGVIVCQNQNDGEVKTLFPRDFAFRAAAINASAKRAHWQVERDFLNDQVLKMHEVFKEAKRQGDVGDPAVIKSRVRERRRAILVTGW